MPISYVDIGVGTSGNVATFDAVLPATYTVDDFLLCFVDRRDDQALTSSTPSGWTFLRNINDVGTSPAAAQTDIYWRPALGPGTDVAPTFTTTTVSRFIVHTVAYRGVDLTSPFITENGQGEAGGAGTTVHSAPALTNTNANAWGVFHVISRQVATPATWAPGTGLTERADTDSLVATTSNLFAETADSNGTVATGSVTYSATSSAGTSYAAMWAGFLNPAVAPTGDPGAWWPFFA